jgi:hypothetical protein
VAADASYAARASGEIADSAAGTDGYISKTESKRLI